MSDMMEFPQTVEEFMEQYKVVDSDHIYSNGIAFVPIFRMKQWFNHVEVKHGKWIDEPIKGVRYHCSVCSGRFDYMWKYCPNCGASMDGERSNNE